MQVDNALIKEEVDSEDIAGVVSRWTGIPVTRMLQSERKLLHLETEHKRVVGQGETIAALSDARQDAAEPACRTPANPSDLSRGGQQELSKTRTAKALAEFLFNDENANDQD